MAKLYNRAGVSTSTPGAGPITLGSAIAAGVAINSCGFQTFAAAGVQDGDVVSYVIFDDNGAWEYGTGSVSLGILTRTLGQSSTGSLLNLSGSAQVFITERKEDILSISETQTANTVLAGPTSGGAATPTFRALVSADLPAGADLTRVNDTNVTLTLGGTPTGALLKATSITVGWTGTLALSRIAQGTDGQLIVGQTSASSLYKSITGDWTLNAAGAATLATVNSNVGTFGSATAASVVTVNAKGLVTAASNTTITPAVGSITGLGTGVATWLATPSSSNLKAAITDETGSGALVFADTPTLIAPLLGTPTSGVLTNCTGLPTAGLVNDAVTFAKMQNIATDSLIGRDTAGTGDPENILLNATLSMDGAGNLQRAALTGDITVPAGSNATTLATVNANVGTFGSASTAAQVTVNAKGLVTAASTNVIREVLLADRIYYVRPDGNDSNTGLVNNSGGAFLTPAKAFAVASSLDTTIYNVYVNFSDNTWTTPFLPTPLIGAGTLYIVGNTSTPANCIISTSSTCIFCNWGQSGMVVVDGFKLTVSSGTGCCLQASGFASVAFRNINFGFCPETHYIASGVAAFVNAIGNYAISASANIHLRGFLGGSVAAYGVTVTISGDPAFGAFAYADATGTVGSAGVSWSGGAAYGPRYIANTNGVIITFGSGGTYFPGDTAGSTATGGQYG